MGPAFAEDDAGAGGFRLKVCPVHWDHVNIVFLGLSVEQDGHVPVSLGYHVLKNQQQFGGGHEGSPITRPVFTSTWNARSS